MSALKGAIKCWTSMSLIVRIIIGLVIGMILGFTVPNLEFVTLLGTLFVSGLRSAAPILVFFLVTAALANAKAPAAMRTVIILYFVSMILSALVAVIGSFMFPIELTLADAATDEAPGGITTVLTNIVTSVFVNPVEALMDANYLGILAWAVVLGIAMRHATQTVKDVFEAVADAVTTVVRWIIACAPFGILGLMYDAISTTGADIFVMYGKLIALLVACMLINVLITNPIIAFATFRKNPYPLVLRCLKDSGITAFFTRSSAANIPVNMALAKRLGLDPNNYSVSIPLGSTINMAGAAVTITVMALAAANTLGIDVDFPTALILCILSALSAAGASGVAGGSLLLIPLACSLFGISNDIAMQVVGIGFIIGVIQDSCETALNSSSDVMLTASAEYRERRRRGIDFNPGKDGEVVYLSAHTDESEEEASVSAA